MRVPHRKAGKYSYIKIDPRITTKKLSELKSNLKKLKKEIQPKLAAEVKRLSLDGDFSENAAYQMAKGHLRSVNNKILKIEKQIAVADVIKIDKNNNSVQVGSIVSLKSNNKSLQYTILGSLETNPSKGVISYSSPLGKKLMQKKVGDNIEVKLGDKTITYKITKIQ